MPRESVTLAAQRSLLLFYTLLLANGVFFWPLNPHSVNPSKYKGNLNQKSSDLSSAPMLTIVSLSLMGFTE